MATDKEKKYWVGFDLGGTKMLCVVYDDEFKMLGRERKKTKGHLGAKTGLSRITETIENALEDAGIDKDDLSGIGVGSPGPIDMQNGILLYAPNLGWENVNLKEHLEKEFGCPAVIGNDVDMGVYGEYRFGAAKGAHCVVGIFPGTGIGGGCIYDGQVLRGKHMTCMEIGHVMSVTDGPLSAAGCPGSLEAVASRLSIAASAAQAAYRGQAPILRKNAGTDLSEIRSGTLASSVDAGEVAVIEIIQDAAKKIGIAIAGMIHLLSPDVIVLGGGLVEAMPKLFLKSVQEGIDEWLLPTYAETYKIKVAELGDDAAVKGAAGWAMHSITE